MRVRCKCFVANAEANDYSRRVKLNLVYSQKPETENARFHAASPSGNVEIATSHRDAETEAWFDQFTPGSFWYVDTERLDQTPDAEDLNPYLALTGIERFINLPTSEDGKLTVQVSGNLKTKLVGYHGRCQITQEVLIANEHVYGEFTEIGQLYRVEFVPTTKEGS